MVIKRRNNNMKYRELINYLKEEPPVYQEGLARFRIPLSGLSDVVKAVRVNSF